jgi:hypothetical protein
VCNECVGVYAFILGGYYSGSNYRKSEYDESGVIQMV